MSTKKIREALAMCRALPLADVAMESIEAAQAEVEAIEKAARYGYLMMTGDIHVATREEMTVGGKVFSAIYEATRGGEE